MDLDVFDNRITELEQAVATFGVDNAKLRAKMAVLEAILMHLVEVHPHSADLKARIGTIIAETCHTMPADEPSDALRKVRH